MFETAGAPTILEPVYTLVGLVAVPLLAALLVTFVRGRAAGWIAILASLGVLGLAGASAARAAVIPQGHALAQHVAQIVRIGQLDLAVELDLDGASAAFVVLAALLGLAAILHATWTARAVLPLPRLSSPSAVPPSSSSSPSLTDLSPPSSDRASRQSLPELEPEELLDEVPGDDLPARLAWIELLTASAILVAVADAWPMVVSGLAASTVAAWGLARGASSRALVASLAGDACVFFGACFLFWSLGGTFTASGYAPDALPRFALVQATGETVPDGKATIALTTYAGAQLVADDGPPLPGEPIKSPLVVTLDPGTVSLRILAGASSQDALVSHVTLAPGKAYVLVPFGPTASLRNLGDQLAVPRPSVGGSTAVPLRAALETRTVLGVRVGLVVSALVLLGLLLRLALTAHRGHGRDGAAPPLEVLSTIFLALRFARLMPPGATSTTIFAAACAATAIVLAASAAAASEPRVALRAVVAAAGALAVAGALAGDPGGAFVITASATLGTAAALSSLDAGGDVRWLGVACAATAGILPAAGSSSGFAGALAAALTAAASGMVPPPVVTVTCALFVVAMALVALASLRVYDTCIRRRAAPSPGLAARALSAVLASLALVGGVALGVGTSPFGGRAAPLARRLVPGGLAFDGAPRLAAAALGAAVAAAAVGVLAARFSATVSGARWAAVFSAPARGTSAGAGAFGGLFSFLGRSVLALDREVVDDITDLVAHAFLRAGALLRFAGAAGGARPGKTLDDAASSAIARAGLDDPRAAELLRTAILLGMVALLALVVLSSLVIG